MKTLKAVGASAFGLLFAASLAFAQTPEMPSGFNPVVFDPQLVAWQGGVPISVGDDTMGAIAAAGAPGGDKDEACAIAGLDKIKDRLN